VESGSPTLKKPLPALPFGTQQVFAAVSKQGIKACCATRLVC